MNCLLNCLLISRFESLGPIHSAWITYCPPVCASEKVEAGRMVQQHAAPQPADRESLRVVLPRKSAGCASEKANRPEQANTEWTIGNRQWAKGNTLNRLDSD